MAKYKSITLVVLRIVIGWHLLYEGLTKLFAPVWSAERIPEGFIWFPVRIISCPRR